MHRFVSITSLPVLLALAGCPPQEEPVHVGKVEAKEQPVKAPEPAPVETKEEPKEQVPAPEGQGVEPADTAAPAAGEGGDQPDDAGKPPPSDSRPKPKTESEPSDDEAGAGVVDGESIFMKKCKSCHGVDGKADTKMGNKHDIPDMTVADWDRKWPKAKIIQLVRDGKSGTKMKAFKDKLSAEEIEAVAAFTRSL